MKAAMLLLIGHWYENRETVSVGQAATDIPFTVEALLQPYKNLWHLIGGIMQAGRLRHRITIQNFTTTRTPSGQPVEKWEDGKPSGPRLRG